MFLMNIFDIIGTVAFAVSGALVGLKYRLDLFGVFVLSILTASGGGLMRDVIIHNGLPKFFTDSKYFITIIVTTVITCILSFYIKKFFVIIKILDGIGLAAFTVFTASQCVLDNIPFIGVVFMSVLTSIGGGIIRDIIVNDIPLVFQSEIYAVASMIGSGCYYLFYRMIPNQILIYICFFITLSIRFLAIYYKLNLPVIYVKEMHM